MKLLLLLFITVNTFAQIVELPPPDPQPETEIIPRSTIVIEEKYFYTGLNGVVNGWQGPWPVDQLDAIDDICEVIFHGESNVPVNITHLKLNEDGTLKCPAEIDSPRKNQELLDQQDRDMLNKELRFVKCEADLASTKSEIAKIVGLHDKGKLLAAQKDCVK